MNVHLVFYLSPAILIFQYFPFNFAAILQKCLPVQSLRLCKSLTSIQSTMIFVITVYDICINNTLDTLEFFRADFLTNRIFQCVLYWKLAPSFQNCKKKNAQKSVWMLCSHKRGIGNHGLLGRKHEKRLQMWPDHYPRKLFNSFESTWPSMIKVYGNFYGWKMIIEFY